MTTEIKFLDLHRQYQEIRGEVDTAIANVIAEAAFISGPYARSFEQEFARYLGAAHCVGVGNGTDALEIAFEALDLPAGSEVIVPANSFIASSEAVTRSGLRVVFCACDRRNYTLDLADVRARITPATSAIVAVHLYGHPADMDPINEIAKKHGLFVLEDCAQAHGSAVAGRTTGTWGDAAAFSFYPTKNLGAIGDGGAILTNDAAMAARVRRLHQYGWQERYISHESGMNSRLDELQAAILRAKLPTLRADNARRAALAAIYTQALRGTVYTPPAPPADTTHVYHQYVIRAPRRDALAAALSARGIPWAIHYPQPVHLQPAYAGRVALGTGGMAATERASQEILSLPLHPHLDEAAIHHVVQALRELA